jgi:hypothetical protein
LFLEPETSLFISNFCLLFLPSLGSQAQPRGMQLKLPHSAVRQPQSDLLLAGIWLSW